MPRKSFFTQLARDHLKDGLWGFMHFRLGDINHLLRPESIDGWSMGTQEFDSLVRIEIRGSAQNGILAARQSNPTRFLDSRQEKAIQIRASATEQPDEVQSLRFLVWMRDYRSKGFPLHLGEIPGGIEDDFIFPCSHHGAPPFWSPTEYPTAPAAIDTMRAKRTSS